MAIDISKLKFTNRRPDGSIVAQCPACAGAGHDETGNHLIVFADGRFGCVANSSDAEHRKEIHRLVGKAIVKRGTRPPVAPSPAVLKPVHHAPPKTLMVLGRLGRVNDHSMEKKGVEGNTATSRVPASNSPEPVFVDPSAASGGAPTGDCDDGSDLLQREGDQPIPDFMPQMQRSEINTEEDIERFLNS